MSWGIMGGSSRAGCLCPNLFSRAATTTGRWIRRCAIFCLIMANVLLLLVSVHQHRRIRIGHSCFGTCRHCCRRWQARCVCCCKHANSAAAKRAVPAASGCRRRSRSRRGARRGRSRSKSRSASPPRKRGRSRTRSPSSSARRRRRRSGSANHSPDRSGSRERSRRKAGMCPAVPCCACCAGMSGLTGRRGWWVGGWGPAASWTLVCLSTGNVDLDPQGAVAAARVYYVPAPESGPGVSGRAPQSQ